MAKRFTFPLETLLSYRKQIERDKQMNFSKVQREFIDKEKQIDDLNILHEKVQLRFKEAKLNQPEVKTWMAYQSYLNDIQRNTFICYQELQEVSKRLEVKRAELIQAVKERKVIEKLREKRYEEYMIEGNRQEQKETDEIGGRSRKVMFAR